MRVQITHLKAPWPLGAVVGDVLELASIPAWAAGKCEQVDEGVAVTIEAKSNEKPADTDEDAQASDSLSEAEAQAAQESARAALEAEATELGISFRVNTSNEKLAERIAEAKKA